MVYTVFYQLTLAFCKISILLLYTRILAYTHARRAALAVIAIVIAYNIFGFVSTLGRCRPLAAFWDNSVQGECNPASHMWALISLHIATDFLIFLLPIPLVYRMTMPLGQKIGVLLIFGLGFLYYIPYTIQDPLCQNADPWLPPKRLPRLHPPGRLDSGLVRRRRRHMGLRRNQQLDSRRGKCLDPCPVPHRPETSSIQTHTRALRGGPVGRCPKRAPDDRIGPCGPRERMGAS